MTIATVTAKAGSARFHITSPADHIQKFWSSGSFYEGGMLAWTQRHYRGGTFVDAGACIGNHSIYYALFCDPGRVIAIEPHGGNRAQLEANIELNGLESRVAVIPQAVSNEPGRGRMESAAPPGHINTGMQQVKSGNEIDITTIDAIIAHYDLDDVTVIKIDVEHMEIEALQGALHLLKTQRPAIFIECPYPETFDRVSAFLSDLGYTARSQHNATPTYEFIVPQESPLHILSLSKHDFAGTAYFLSDAINTTTSHISRALRWHSGKFSFPGDVTAPDDRMIRNLWKWADVIHIHDEPGPLPSGLPSKPTVVTFHGSTYRKRPDHWRSMVERAGHLPTVATPDLTLWGLPWLPDCRPPLDHYRDLSPGFTVAHSPSQRAKKGTSTIIEACRIAEVKLDLIEDLPWEEALARRGAAHLIIDQLAYGYGCSSIEAWAMDLPVISGTRDDGLRSHIDSCLGGNIPYAHSLPDAHALAGSILTMRDDPQVYAYWAEIGRDHYRIHHAPDSAAATALSFYNQTIISHGSANWRKWQETRSPAPLPPKGQRRNYSTVILRYLGKGGKSSWFPPHGTGVRYEFGKGRRERGLVYTPDVEWFLEFKDKAGRPLFVSEEVFNVKG